jgi:hypothetical protein
LSIVSVLIVMMRHSLSARFVAHFMSLALTAPCSVISPVLRNRGHSPGSICHLFVLIRYCTYIRFALVDSVHVLDGLLPVITFKLMRNPQLGFQLMLRISEIDYKTQFLA